MQINFNFRDWTELLVLTNSALVPPASPYVPIVVPTHLTTAPVLGPVQVWANYAIVSNEERRRMGCAIRDILIEQVQTAPRQNYTPLTNASPTFDIRFSHAIKALFFSVRNKTGASEWSNYATSSPVVTGSTVNFEPAGSFDPIANTTLIYENTNRLGAMGSDYFSLINPFYHAPTIPSFIGYHLYSYSLHFYDLDPMGSTNYGKLTNVSIVPQASPAAVSAAGGSGGFPGSDYAQSYEFVIVAVVPPIAIAPPTPCVLQPLSPVVLTEVLFLNVELSTFNSPAVYIAPPAPLVAALVGRAAVVASAQGGETGPGQGQKGEEKDVGIKEHDVSGPLGGQGDGGEGGGVVGGVGRGEGDA